MDSHTRLPGNLFEDVTQAVAHRIGNRHMSNTSGAEKTLLPRERAVNELINDDEVAWCQFVTNDPQAETEIMSVTPRRFRASMLAR